MYKMKYMSKVRRSNMDFRKSFSTNFSVMKLRKRRKITQVCLSWIQCRSILQWKRRHHQHRRRRLPHLPNESFLKPKFHQIPMNPKRKFSNRMVIKKSNPWINHHYLPLLSTRNLLIENEHRHHLLLLRLRRLLQVRRLVHHLRLRHLLRHRRKQHLLK